MLFDMLSKWLFILMFPVISLAVDIQTNAVNMPHAPEWLKRTRVEKITDRMQTKLGWTVRKVDVLWYTDLDSFMRAQSLGPFVRAVTNKSKGQIHMGPSVTSEDFDSVFGHEMVHVILGQRYKDSVPGWLEEGLANHFAKHGKVDYAWLKTQPLPPDVRKLSHPFSATVSTPRYHYQASHALAEMIAKKCDLTNLLSAAKKLEDYLPTYCEIKDLNAEFANWIKKN